MLLSLFIKTKFPLISETNPLGGFTWYKIETNGNGSLEEASITLPLMVCWPNEWLKIFRNRNIRKQILWYIGQSFQYFINYGCHLISVSKKTPISSLRLSEKCSFTKSKLRFFWLRKPRTWCFLIWHRVFLQALIKCHTILFSI